MPKKSEHTLQEEINLDEVRLRGRATIKVTLVEIISGCPTSLGGSKSSDPGWAGCKERDGGHPHALMAGCVYPQDTLNNHQAVRLSGKACLDKATLSTKYLYQRKVFSCSLYFIQTTSFEAFL